MRLFLALAKAVAADLLQLFIVCFVIGEVIVVFSAIYSGALHGR